MKPLRNQAGQCHRWAFPSHAGSSSPSEPLQPKPSHRSKLNHRAAQHS